jgi:hypothetical protein
VIRASLRRRHPRQKIELPRSAEPVPESRTDREQPHLVADQKVGEMAAWVRDLAAQRQAFRIKTGERQGQEVSSEDLGWGDLGEAFPAWRTPGRDAALQPAKPQITLPAGILLLAEERDTEPEAAD